ncbi:hypothetical protein JL721_10165 [Aureococcus anophagefferens]|nr:hypothetical protein JL721_10165 [Aureococcus anophagefferens]
MSGMAAKGCPAARVAVVALLASRALAHVVYPTPEPTPEPTMIRTEVGYDSKTCRGGLCTRDATRTCVDESPGWVFTFPSGGNSTCFGLCYSSVNRNMFHNRTAKFSCEVAVDAGVDTDMDAALAKGGVCRACRCRSNCYEACLPFPTILPSPVPSQTFEPTGAPTANPSDAPTVSPYPTEAPTDAPKPLPTIVPYPAPTRVPYPRPTRVPRPLPTYAPTRELEIWSPAAGSVTSGRDVDLGFQLTLPEETPSDACELCVSVGDEVLTCQGLEVMLTEQLALQDLLPGTRELRLALRCGGGAAPVEASATAVSVVGAEAATGAVDVDITAARAGGDPWRAAVPGAANASGGRAATSPPSTTQVLADELARGGGDFVLASGHKTSLLKPPYCARDPERLYRDAPDTPDQYLGLWDLAKGPVATGCGDVDADDGSNADG